MTNELKYLSQQVARQRLDRRSFLGRAGALGVSAAAASTLLSSAVMAQGAVKGGTIKVAVEGGSSTDSLDPALVTNSTGTLVNRLWGEPLVELDADGGLEMRLASEVIASDDATTWTFKIREGVTFSDGKSLTAEDVLATLERHAGEDSKSGALGILSGIKSMRADGNAFIVELTGPNADLPFLLSDYHLMIQPNGGKDAPDAAIGTGPYILKSAEMGVRFVAEKNPNYWNPDLGHASTIEVTVINDDTARVAALQSGQVHMCTRVPPKVASLVGRMSGVEVHSVPSAGHYVFIMHANTAPFDNNDLRLALKYAMNREEMVDKIQQGVGNAVTAMSNSHKMAEGTVTESKEVEEALEAIHDKVSSIAEMNTHIAEAVKQQAATAEDIDRNIVGISRVAEDNVGNAAETTRASEEMATKANQLREMLTSFKV